ncbi:heavy-metal-associated domain-containing protein [Boudabousia marimammalium]|uniref:HMA domain-containing protein n=1 Tax=Boudabousia marimammalium TaxID=156892 RepID=A0A1Q5PSP7_9ACTO|nr:heavy-metal-associated domain-containing protein [Boudabousia marimammalium]OKL50608.1 hypothetical protein BM477_01225 [Boudabousia marimammalium]
MATSTNTVELHVKGMTCQSCVANLSEELADVTGVVETSVDLNPEGVSTVTVTSDRHLEDTIFKSAVTEAGYQLVGLSRTSLSLAGDQKAENGDCDCNCGRR